MKKPNIVRLAVAVASGAAMLLAIVGVSAQPPPKNPATLQGVWLVTRHGINCNTGQELISLPAIMSFNQDGTMTAFFSCRLTQLPLRLAPNMAFGHRKDQITCFGM